VAMMCERNTFRGVFVVVTAFTAGFALMVFEMFGTRVMAPFFGGGMPIWGATISVIMTGMGFGYVFGGKLADKRPSVMTLSILLLPAALFMCAFPILGEFVCCFIDSFGFSRRLASLISAFFLFPFPVFFLGAVSPLLIKLKVDSVSEVGSGSGSVYATGTVGGVVGALMSSFILIGVISSSLAIFSLGILLFLNILFLLLFSIIFKS
jgi:MFS family permease